MFMELIRNRRSIRRYADRPVEPEKIDLLVEAMLRSPSSRSLNPWQFVVVTDRDMLGRLSNSKPHGASFIKNAPLGIVVCGDPEVCDVWIEDLSIASIFIHLAANSLGLGSCWIQIRERMHADGQTAEAHIAGLLGLPPSQKVLSMVAIGYPAESKRPHSADSLQYGKISYERYGGKRPI